MASVLLTSPLSLRYHYENLELSDKVNGEYNKRMRLEKAEEDL